MTGTLILDPLLPLPLLAVLALLSAAAVALALWRRLPGWWLRGLAALALLAALANPALQQEERRPLSDIVIAILDESASQRIAGRAEATAAALAALEAEVAAEENAELRVVRMGDGEGDAGSRLMSALTAALAEEPPGRVAAIVLVTDGRVHDMEAAPPLPAPLHVLLTGEEADWDRRLVVRDAPAYGILGQELRLGLRIEDQGAAPEAGLSAWFTPPRWGRPARP